ncbi:MAG: TetR/AcrR family transcriptional regulator [Beijerinckiaceae bacterium]|nr:TetR/AcrR family transcriptional regulator [Beijerinckiaceae bacterium]
MDEVVTDRRKWHQILDGARRVFLEQGFDGASVGDIVRAAGISKGTLYAYFPSKEKLFETLIFEDRRRQAEQLFKLDMENDDVRSELRALGLRFLELVSTPLALSHLRTVIAVAARFPEIGRAYYEAGPQYGMQQVAAYLVRHSGKSLVDIADPETAASRFIDLCKSGLHMKLLMGLDVSFSKDDLKRNVEEAVEIFMSRYGAPS